jgi:cytochrome c peroxidase
MVKSSRKITVLFAVFIIVLGSIRFKPHDTSVAKKTDQYFQSELNVLKSKLNDFIRYSRQGANRKVLRQQFIACRLAYKRLAVLSEYFNVYETKFLNGPALNRVEEDAPDNVIPPQGFQAMEEIVFGNGEPNNKEQLVNLAEDILLVLKRMEDEPERIYKFRNELVWDAIRAATIRLVALGITGFDSPVAFNSLDEARASIGAMKNILLLFKNEMDKKQPNASASLINLLSKASSYIQLHNDFEKFDRLEFISSYINPFYKQLSLIRAKSGIAVPEGLGPVNYSATSIFQDDFFDINFFSPGKEYWITKKRIALGKKLFSDPILSGTKNRSCSSCHVPGNAFADGLKAPYAIDNKKKLSRNTPTLWNSAFQTKQFLDARSDILEDQLKEVVHNSDEMQGSLLESVDDLKGIDEYVNIFKDAYPEEGQPLNPFNVANAISSYVRSLIALNSRFDLYMRGNKAKLSASEKNGFNLFAGKAKCATCHFLPLFNGLVPPEFTDTETEVLGTPATKSKTNPALDADLGKYYVSNASIHKFSFKTPTLRNINLTAPYMHNGVFDTLEEVMDFYNEGGGAGLSIAPENQTLPTGKLNLSKKEIGDIIAFMKALTDSTVTAYK